MASGGSMSFPTLTDETIINFCTEVVGAEYIPITPAALQNPTMESTIGIFRFFVNDMFGWNLDAALVVPFDAMSRAHYFETHQEQVPVMRFYRFLRALLQRVHYDSFSIEDLLQPRSKRLRRQLSALANFALHNQRMMEEYGDEVLEKHKEDILYQERLVKENRTLMSNIHKEIEREDELKALNQKEQELIAERNQELSALHDQKEQLEQETKQTRAEIARLEDNISESAVEDAKINEEMASLEAQLVGSPEKVRQTLTRAEEELQAAEEQREATSERQQDLRRTLQQSEQLAAGLERLQLRSDVLVDLAERSRDVNDNIKSVTDEMDTVRHETSEKQSANRQLANRCEMLEESREGQMQKNERYIKAKEEELEKRKQVQEEARTRLAADKQEAAQQDVLHQQLQQRKQQDAELYQKQLETLQRQDDQLKESVEWVKTESDKMQDELLTTIEASFP